MIISAAKNWKINIKESILVGDRKKDIEAGYSVGLKCYFIDRNYNEKNPRKRNVLMLIPLQIYLLIKNNEIK